MKTTIMRSDKRKNPEQVEYEVLTFAECKSLHGHACILDRQGKIANVKITSVKTWKTRPDEIEVHCKFGLYEYFVVTVTAERPNTELVRIVEKQEEPVVVVIEENPECPYCNGIGIPMGVLGQTRYFRCESCGMDFSEQNS